MNTHHSGKQEDRMPILQNMRIHGDKDVTYGGQDNNGRYEAHGNKVMHYKQKGRGCEINMSSGCISHKPVMLGIKQ